MYNKNLSVSFRIVIYPCPYKLCSFRWSLSTVLWIVQFNNGYFPSQMCSNTRLSDTICFWNMSTQNKRQRIWAKCSFVIDEIIVPLLISLGRIRWCKMRKRRSTSSKYSFLTDENKYKSSNVVGMNVVMQNELTSVLVTDKTITDKPRSRAGYSTDHRTHISHCPPARVQACCECIKHLWFPCNS